MAAKSLCVLGATGSIGLNTLDVVERHSDKFSVFALSAHNDWRALLSLCEKHRPVYAVLSGNDHAGEAKSAFADSQIETELLIGAQALVEIAEHPDVDIVMAAIVGAAGLRSSLAAATAGKRVLLANKESLVLAGPLFMSAVSNNGAVLLPIDSEHNAIFQCLPGGYTCGEAPGKEVSKILLTASGGPFRNYDIAKLAAVTPEEACAHPNWSMGRKISVDSASLMNKGLELIEACWLFDVGPENIDVVIHPQSIIHSMVQYRDGSVLAQMGQPDMRTPIAYGLAWPERIDAGVADLDFYALSRLEFEQPDVERFPCLQLARDAYLEGGFVPAFLNAANEIAVEAFLKGNIRFTDIPDIILATMKRAPRVASYTIEEVFDADAEAREFATELTLQRVTQRA